MIYDKEHCYEMLQLYIGAEKAVLTGQSYKIGNRELTRANLSEIIKEREKWETRYAIANNGGKKRKMYGVLPRDL